MKTWAAGGWSRAFGAAFSARSTATCGAEVPCQKRWSKYGIDEMDFTGQIVVEE
ncbi:MAG: hypothetical protein IPI85_15555 [Dehalococcoidia bacterium]|nr:hypothetical protein [Dehalococcoidia bacterium]